VIALVVALSARPASAFEISAADAIASINSDLFILFPLDYKKFKNY
jgi:hypothetical protein